MKQSSHIFQHSYVNHNSVIDIVTCISLCPSVTVKEQLACRKHFINILFIENFFRTVFEHQNNLDIFWTTFWVIIGLRIEHNLRNVRIVHLLWGPRPTMNGNRQIWRFIHLKFGGKCIVREPDRCVLSHLDPTSPNAVVTPGLADAAHQASGGLRVAPRVVVVNGWVPPRGPALHLKALE